jgi:hypothetical protein
MTARALGMAISVYRSEALEQIMRRPMIEA